MREPHNRQGASDCLVCRARGSSRRCQDSGASNKVNLLGIELDTAELVARLPWEKVVRLRRAIEEWRWKKVCTKRELLSLIGQLQHACCVVRVGRTFLRRMIELSSIMKELYHRVRLNEGF